MMHRLDLDVDDRRMSMNPMNIMNAAEDEDDHAARKPERPRAD